ncbi:MAG: hypothetical protein ACT4OM_13485 [Actinomycetota bacterium]
MTPIDPAALQAVALQLADELHLVLWPAASLMPGIRDLILDPQALMADCERLAHQLLDDREQVDELGINADEIAAETAQDVICGLWPRSEPDHEWWTTPLGRACARSYGIEDAGAVSASVAASRLGVSRGRVYQLLREGKLDRHPDGGVVNASVMRRLAFP